MTHLLDATAVIDLVTRGPGAQRVEGLLRGARVCAVNWLEVLRFSTRVGVAPGTWAGALQAAGAQVVGFSADHAASGPAVREAEARIRAGAPAREWRGLSTADVACIATAAVDGLVVVTSDALMADVSAELGVELLDHRAGG